MAAGLITAAQVAALLGVSRSKVYELARSGRLVSYRIDDAVRFAPEDVEAFKEACRVPKPAPGPSPRPRSTRLPAAWSYESSFLDTCRKLGIEPRLTPQLSQKRPKRSAR